MAKVLERHPETLNKALKEGYGLRELSEFCDQHDKNYILGAGRIASGMKHYFDQIGVSIEGFVTSKNMSDFRMTYTPKDTGLIVGVDDSNLDELKPLFEEFIDKSDVFVLPIDLRQDMYVRNSKEYIKKYLCLVLNIIDNCNLNCAYCRNFAPLVNEGIRSFEKIKKDLLQLKAVGIDHLFKIFVSGGEPLLHPDLFKILKLCRQEYPNSVIECDTNGLLFKKFTDKQLRRLNELNITITYTEYPIEGFDSQYIYDTLDLYNIDYVSINHHENIYSDKENKFFVKCTFNFDRSAPKYGYFYCTRSVGRATVFLRDGRLFTCHTTESIDIFNNYFNKNLEITDNDFIDLYNTTPEEIYEFKIKRIPFCDYCSIDKNEERPFRISERKIEEWT